MEYINYAITGVFGIIFYLLKQKDTIQGKHIEKLYTMHDRDAEALQELKLKIAENHYPKTELDVKFLGLETATRDGFQTLGIKFDKLSDALVSHITKEVR